MALAETDVDPIQELAHDHRDLNELLIAVHGALSRVEHGQSRLDDELHEIKDGIEAFRDALLVHFAREQEGLFPFVVAHVPNAQEQADAIVVEHDRIADALTALVKEMSALERDASGLPMWRATLARFEELYTAHSRSELAFLTEVGRSLANNEAATQQLRTLLAE